MAKLKLLLDRSLDEDERIMSHYKNLMSEIENKVTKVKYIIINSAKLLHTKTWASEKDSVQFGDTEIAEFISFFSGLLSNGGRFTSTMCISVWSP